MLLVGLFVVSSCVFTGREDPGSTRATTGTEPDTIEPGWERAEIEVPTSAVRIPAGSSIQEAVDAADAGSIFLLESGVYRLQQIEPRDDDTFVGEEGAVLSGARVLDAFRQEGTLWVHGGVTAAGEERGRCKTEYPACSLPEDLFVDDELIKRVLSLDEVDEDTWYLDQDTDELWLGRDPEGHTVEISVMPFAFDGTGNGITLEGLVIEKYASPAQRGTVVAGGGWTIVNTEIRFNHGQAIRLGPGLTVRDSYLHHNGQFGIAGGGVGAKIVNNEISHNGIAGFSSFWAAGGTKFLHVNDLVLEGNFVHSNWGPGLWTDGGGDGTIYENNRLVGNEHAGIKHEISGSAEIVGNHVEGNGFENDVDLRGPGILVRESGPATISNNKVFGNNDAIVLLHDDDRTNDTGNRLAGITVTDNDIALDGGRIAYIGDVSESALGTDIVFEDNRYYGDEDATVFVIEGRTLDFGSWEEVAHDSDSAILTRDSFP